MKTEQQKYRKEAGTGHKKGARLLIQENNSLARSDVKYSSEKPPTQPPGAVREGTFERGGPNWSNEDG